MNKLIFGMIGLLSLLLVLMSGSLVLIDKVLHRLESNKIENGYNNHISELEEYAKNEGPAKEVERAREILKSVKVTTDEIDFDNKRLIAEASLLLSEYYVSKYNEKSPTERYLERIHESGKVYSIASLYQHRSKLLELSDLYAQISVKGKLFKIRGSDEVYQRIERLMTKEISLLRSKYESK